MSLYDRTLDEAAASGWKYQEAVAAAKSEWGKAWSKLGPRAQAAEIALASMVIISQQDEEVAAKIGAKFQSLADVVTRLKGRS